MKKDSLIKTNRRRAGIAGLVAIITFLIIVFYYNTRKRIDLKKAESEQSTSRSADSILIEKLSNKDTITSLQDPIDTTKH